MNEHPGACGCFRPKELQGERVGTDELLQMTATEKADMGTCPFDTGNGRENFLKEIHDLIVKLISYFSGVQLL